MATIIQGGPDLRQQALEQGVARGVETYFQERERKKQEQKFLDAFRAVSATTSYDEAVKAMGLVDKEILTNPQAMQLLSQHIERKFPAQEAAQIESPAGMVQTTAVRKGDVAGAIAAARQAGGRLTQDVEVERTRTAEKLEAEFKEDIARKKLGLEERRTKAAEDKARAAMVTAGQANITEKDKELARVAALVGGDLSRAMKIVYGLEETSIDPVTNEVRVLDKTTGRQAIVPQESVNELEGVPTPEEGERLWDAALAGTGPVSALRAAMSLPAAYMGVFVPDPVKTIEARQRLVMASNRLARVLRETRAFAEMEWIKKEMSFSPNIFIHPEVMRRRMVTVDSQLRLWQAQETRDSLDRSLPSKDRAAAKNSAKEIRNFLSELSVPEEHLAGSEDTSQQVPPTVQDKYPSITWSQWQRLSPDKRRRLMEE